jgi:hypothetical protein
MFRNFNKDSVSKRWTLLETPVGREITLNQIMKSTLTFLLLRLRESPPTIVLHSRVRKRLSIHSRMSARHRDQGEFLSVRSNESVTDLSQITS